MPLTWYLISTLHILPSLVHFHCPNHAVPLVSYLSVLTNRDFFYQLLSIFCLFIFIQLQLLCTFQSFFSKNFGLLFSFHFLIFLLTHLDYKKQNMLNKTKKNYSNKRQTMEFPSSDFPWGHLQISSLHFYSLSSQSLFLSFIPTPLWPQVSLVGLYSTPSPPPNSGRTF